MRQFLTYCQHRIPGNLLCQLWENADQFQPSRFTSAGLPEGSFSPFDFDSEFRARHGIRLEEVNQPWHSRRSSVASDLHHPTSDDGTTSRLTNISSLTPASPTRGLEVIRTPGVT